MKRTTFNPKDNFHYMFLFTSKIKIKRKKKSENAMVIFHIIIFIHLITVMFNFFITVRHKLIFEERYSLKKLRSLLHKY